MVRRYVQQMRQGMGPQVYRGWPEIVILAPLEGVHIGVYTRDNGMEKPTAQGVGGGVAHGHQESDVAVG